MGAVVGSRNREPLGVVLVTGDAFAQVVGLDLVVVIAKDLEIDLVKIVRDEDGGRDDTTAGNSLRLKVDVAENVESKERVGTLPFA